MRFQDCCGVFFTACVERSQQMRIGFRKPPALRQKLCLCLLAFPAHCQQQRVILALQRVRKDRSEVDRLLTHSQGLPGDSRQPSEGPRAPDAGDDRRHHEQHTRQYESGLEMPNLHPGPTRWLANVASRSGLCQPIALAFTLQGCRIDTQDPRCRFKRGDAADHLRDVLSFDFLDGKILAKHGRATIG
jgi:hypothetical protein